MTVLRKGREKRGGLPCRANVAFTVAAFGCGWKGTSTFSAVPCVISIRNGSMFPGAAEKFPGHRIQSRNLRPADDPHPLLGCHGMGLKFECPIADRQKNRIGYPPTRWSPPCCSTITSATRTNCSNSSRTSPSLADCCKSHWLAAAASAWTPFVAEVPRFGTVVPFGLPLAGVLQAIVSAWGAASGIELKPTWDKQPHVSGSRFEPRDPASPRGAKTGEFVPRFLDCFPADAPPRIVRSRIVSCRARWIRALDHPEEPRVDLGDRSVEIATSFPQPSQIRKLPFEQAQARRVQADCGPAELRLQRLAIGLAKHRRRFQIELPKVGQVENRPLVQHGDRISVGGS